MEQRPLMRVPRGLLLLLLLPLPLPSAHGQEDREDPVIHELRQGVQLYQKRDFEKALTHFARARSLAPGDWQGPTWQALTRLQQAIGEKDVRRKLALTREAESMTTVLVKECHLLFQHPLRHYLLGVAAAVRGEQALALRHLKEAHVANARMFVAFEGIDLRGHVDRAFARALVDYAKRLILNGNFGSADNLLRRAETILKTNQERIDKTAWRDFQRSMAVVDEALGRLDSAIARLRECIKLFANRPDLQTEFLGSIAQIYFKSERYKEGLKVLAEAPADSTHPYILVARCTAVLHPALKARPDDPRVEQALAFYRKAMESFPEDEVYRLIEDYATLVLHKVGPREAERARELLQDTVRRLLVEVKRRPECPGLYYLLYRISKLLGDAQSELKYENLHAAKKKAYERAARFDDRGRPRCR